MRRARSKWAWLCTHTRMHTHTLAHTHTHTPTHTRVHTHVHTHAHTHTHTHTHLYTHMHTQEHIHMRTCVFGLLFLGVTRAFEVDLIIHTHICTHTHAHTRTHTCTHSCTRNSIVMCVRACSASFSEVRRERSRWTWLCKLCMAVTVSQKLAL